MKTDQLETKRNEIARLYPGHLIAVECGDFYEFLGDDAVIASKELQITLTARNKQSEAPLPMCGFPYYRLESDMKILNDKGYHVAVCLKEYGVRSNPREVVRVYKSDVEVVEI